MGNIDLLTEAELFQLLPPDALTSIADSATVCELQRNDVLFGQGDEAASMYVVRSGRIAIASKAEDGRESVMALMDRGDLFGEMGMFDESGLGRSAEARALEPSEVLEIGYQPVREILESDPHLLWGVITLLVSRLRSTDEALADAFFLDVTGRTAKRLLEMAGDAEEFSLPVTQEELAGMVGASRERVNKAIASFIRLGWLSSEDGRYRVGDRAALENRSR